MSFFKTRFGWGTVDWKVFLNTLLFYIVPSHHFSVNASDMFESNTLWILCISCTCYRIDKSLPSTRTKTLVLRVYKSIHLQNHRKVLMIDFMWCRTDLISLGLVGRGHMSQILDDLLGVLCLTSTRLTSMKDECQLKLVNQNKSCYVKLLCYCNSRAKNRLVFPICIKDPQMLIMEHLYSNNAVYFL